MRRREQLTRLTYIIAGLIAIVEALLPWDTSSILGGPYTPSIPAIVQIAAAAIILPVLYFMQQGDFRHKQQSFNLAMSDYGRRLLFLDYTYDPEEFEMQERMQGALLLPAQRALDSAMKSGSSKSLSERVSHYYKILPSPTYESDRMGMLSIGHPRTAISWGVVIAMAWLLFPPIIPLPMMGISIGTSYGLSVMPVLLLVYLFVSRANTRFAFELALYDWLRLG